MPRSRKTPLLPLESELRAAAGVLYLEMNQPNEELQAWAERSGLVNGRSNLRRVLAQQAALELLLVVVIETLPAEALDRLPFHEVMRQLPYGTLLASSQARQVLGDPVYLRDTLLKELPRDLLGELYELLTPQAERRTLGQYWTPQPIVEFMTAWTLQAGPRVLEPSVGSGRFLQEVERRWTQRADGAEALVRGYEISPLVLMVALVNAALRHADNVRFDLHLTSFLDSQPDVAAFDGVICNPPYTRHHHITPEQKDQLSARIQCEFGVTPSGFTSLFVYFLLHALGQVRPGGRLAFITPAELYEASYAKQVKHILKQQAQPDAIVVFDQSQQVFKGVDTAGCITLAQRGGNPDDSTLLIEVQEWPGTQTLLDVMAHRQPGSFPWGTVTLLAAEDLTPEAKWSNPHQMIREEEPRLAAHLPTLGTVAKVLRGVATGANAYFCLSTEEVHATGIPFDYFRPVITKTRKVLSYQLRHEHLEHLQQEQQKVWMFTCYQSRETAPPAVQRYIQQGEADKLHQRSLLKLKKGKWYMVERREPPPILFTYLSRGGTRFIYNAAGAQALNVFLLIYPKREISQHPDLLKAFTAILNATPIKQGLHAVGRSYGGDTVKLEPRELDRLPVLDPTTLPPDTVQNLAGLLEQLDHDPHGDHQATLDQLVAHLIQQQPQITRTPVMQPMLF